MPRVDSPTQFSPAQLSIFYSHSATPQSPRYAFCDDVIYTVSTLSSLIEVRTVRRFACFLVTLALGTLPGVFWAQEPPPVVIDSDLTHVVIYVTVPADAILEVDGVAVKQMGPERRLLTPLVRIGQQGQYTFKATYTKDGKTVSVEQRVIITGGQVCRVDMTKDAPRAVAKNEEPKNIAPKVVEPKKEEPKKVEPKKEEPKPPLRLDVPYVPTSPRIVATMLQLADVKKTDIVYDLGCGDGRIVIAAVRDYGAAKGLGIELEPARVKLSRDNVTKEKLAAKIDIREGDVLKVQDFSEASVVTLYLLPEVNEKLKPFLKKTLKPGARVVSHDFDMGADWKADKEVVVMDDDGTEHTVYLWTIKDVGKKEPPKVQPKVEPKTEPKVQPKVEPKAEPKVEPKASDTIKVPYVPTPQTIVDAMLKFADVKEGEVVYDLGCGDGRIPITAVKDFKAKKGFGLDIDPKRIQECTENAKTAKVESKVEFKVGDVLQLKDVSEANVVTLYLFPELNERIAPMLQKTLKPGSRIVSHDFLIGDWKYDKEITVKDGAGMEHSLYLWIIPEKKK